MKAKIDNLIEMGKVLSVKESMNDHLLSLFGRLGIGHLLRCLSLEKHDGVSASTLIIALCLFRINGASIFSCYRQHYIIMEDSQDYKKIMSYCLWVNIIINTFATLVETNKNRERKNIVLN